MLSTMVIYHQTSIIQPLVNKINKNFLTTRVVDNSCFTLTPSAYDIAWVAMVGDPMHNYKKPMFMSCLEWILNNQSSDGFWGEKDCHGNPTIKSLPATLACMVALKTWNLGHESIERGLTFIKGYSSKLVEVKDKQKKKFPRWFCIVFPGMVEVAQRIKLQVNFDDDDVCKVASHIFRQRHEILNERCCHSSLLLSCLEVLPRSVEVQEAAILNSLSNNGSLFGSPSATAAAFMATRNPQALSYLCHLVQTCNGQVPPVYPIDEGYINVIKVNQIQRLGLSKHFPNRINDMLKRIHREYNAQETSKLCCLVPANIYKSSLAFQILRLHGYHVSARKFCWFLDDEYALKHIEDNYEEFASALYYLYRATNLMFESEEELQKLRSFSRRLLAKCSKSKNLDDGVMLWPHLQETIKCELAIPWMARMDHLEHREWIEANEESPVWLAKFSFFRMWSLNDEDLLELAKSDYELCQVVFQKELEELIRWSTICGLMDMGFAREKTTYCYFAVASTTSLPYDSDVRLIVAKSAVLITIFDDYFDMEGSLDELRILANAVKRWNNKGLQGHSKVLFDALDTFVCEVAKNYFDKKGVDITAIIRKLWCEVVASWLTEATWSKTGHIPSMASYIETGMISIAAHLLVLQASCFVTPSLSPRNLNPSKYHDITKLLMVSCRLLNDLQSYEKEIKDGKINSIMLYLRENPNSKLEDAIHYIESMLEKTKMKLLEHALVDGDDDGDDGGGDEELPKPCKMLHLTTLKVFQMFFNSSNIFDTKDALLNDINKAIFVPFEHHHTNKVHHPTKPSFHPKKKFSVNNYLCNNTSLKCHRMRPNIQNYRRAPFTTMLPNHLLVRTKMKVSSPINFFVLH